MDRSHIQSVHEQSSKPQHRLADVEDNLGNKRAMGRSLVEFYRSDPSLVKLLPPKKRPFKENDAYDVVGDNFGDRHARETSQILVHCDDRFLEHTLPPRKRPFYKEGRIRTAASEGTPTSKDADKERFRADTASSVRKRKRGIGGVERNGNKEGRHKEEGKYGTCLKTGSSGKQLKDRDSDTEELYKAAFGSDSEVIEEEDDEYVTSEIFKRRHPEEIRFPVEHVMAKLKAAAEEDAELNRQGKPAVYKLRKLHLLTDYLSKKHLQQEFLDHGVLNLLKTWLEPVADGSLPDMNIRRAILKILNDLPIDLQQYEIREQIKNGLGKIVMFLSKSEKETTSNRKIAKDLIEKWFPIHLEESKGRKQLKTSHLEKAIEFLSKSDEKTPANIILAEDLTKKWKQEFVNKNINIEDARPEPVSLDFVVRRPSKINPDKVGAPNIQTVENKCRQRVDKKLEQMKKLKKKQLQATKVSALGRRMLKFV